MFKSTRNAVVEVDSPRRCMQHHNARKHDSTPRLVPIENRLRQVDTPMMIYGVQ